MLDFIRLDTIVYKMSLSCQKMTFNIISMFMMSGFGTVLSYCENKKSECGFILSE